MRNPNRPASWIIILILSLWSFSLAQIPPEIRELEQGKPIERELAGGEAHAYSIQLKAGQFLSVVVDQRGIDVVVSLFGLDGKKITEVDNPNGTQGPELVSMGVDTSGIYQLEVHPFSKGVNPGRYVVKIEELRVARPEDNSRIAAEKAYGEAVNLRSQGTVESRQRAIEKHQEALRLWRAAGDGRREASTLHRMCIVYNSAEEFQKALDYFNQALMLHREVGNRQAEAATLNSIGNAVNLLDEKQQALDYLNHALLIHRELGDRQGEANALHDIATAYKLYCRQPRNALYATQHRRSLYSDG